MLPLILGLGIGLGLGLGVGVRVRAHTHTQVQVFVGEGGGSVLHVFVVLHFMSCAEGTKRGHRRYRKNKKRI
jgi:hypothetical protein